MSLLLRTIEAFPRGRTTEQLNALLDIAFEPAKREAILRELSALQIEGAVTLGRDGRWRPTRRPTSNAQSPFLNSPTGGSKDVGEDRRLRAVRVGFARETRDEAPAEDLAETDTSPPDPRALLRYYRSALQSDPRGALTQSPDRHGAAFQLFAGEGSPFADEASVAILRIDLDHLPGDLREALIRRDGEENGVALGWPIEVGRRQGLTAIRPVGLVAATWRRGPDLLEIRVEADDVLVNPDWVREAARGTAWSREALEGLFRGPGGAGLPWTEFRARLAEAAARSMRGRLSGRRFAAEIDLDATGLHDALALFLPTGSTFTAGAVRDLDSIAAWPVERLEATALAPLLGLDPDAVTSLGASPINLGPQNAEQISAARLAASAPLSVVTGPPGTGKSEVIVSMAASALWRGERVLVASKNHQALDAVEDRLSRIAPDAPFMARTLDPARDLDRSFADVLSDLISEPSVASGVGPDPAGDGALRQLADARTAALDALEARRFLRLQLAEDLERLDARRAAAGVSETTGLVEAPKQPSLWIRLFRWLGILRRPYAQVTGVAQETLSNTALERRVRDTLVDLERVEREEVDDPVRITEEIRKLAPKVLGPHLVAAAALDEEARLALADARADMELHGEMALDRAIAGRVLEHRPLWLASVLGAPKRVPLEDGLFDLVIFDEAGQCDIGSALPLLARARRAVIVGDDRQLAFIPQLGAAQDRNLMAAQGLPRRGMGRFAQGARSLFDLARATRGAPAVMLRDQYRSAPEIVDYLNGDFYGGRLRPAVDVTGLRPPLSTRPGLAWTHVPPRVDATGANVNRAEVDEIVVHLRTLLVEQDYTGEVGVIAPFRPQVLALAEALGAAIPAERRERAALRIATVDGFQGQERDLILFSPVVHARAPASAVAFLQRDWRRMNVAISRARAVAHVFGDLDYARSGAIRRLASLAARATEPRRAPAEGVFDSVWEERLYAAMRGDGLDPRPQYEIAGRRLDFALFGADGLKLDVEVDGRRWHQDTDGGRKLDDLWRDHQLRSLGWRVRRFWVDELHRDMEGCLDRIRDDLA